MVVALEVAKRVMRSAETRVISWAASRVVCYGVEVLPLLVYLTVVLMILG